MIILVSNSLEEKYAKKCLQSFSDFEALASTIVMQAN